MDIVKRAYLKTVEEWPDNLYMRQFRKNVKAEVVRLIKLRAYNRRDWPRELGRLPAELKSKKTIGGKKA